MNDSAKIKEIVKNRYSQIATKSSGCGCSCQSSGEISKSIGYSDEDLKISGDANLGLGCGNPVGFGNIKEGDTVLDLGCGAGVDCFLAAKRVGKHGKVIGVDMTEEMIKKAKRNAKNKGIKNIEFIVAEIENLPQKDNTVDIIITNCVINLTPDKSAAFKEAFRVLKPGGKLYLSDIVLLKELSEKQKNDEDLLAGCVAGALLKNDYLNKIKGVGFSVKILAENKKISKSQYSGIALESLLLEAKK
jgi:arsenite methyltransferase